MGQRGLVKELARYHLAADITNSATSLTVGTVVGGVEVDDDALPFYAAIEDGTSNYESVLVTAISGTTWTVVRAQESTSGVAHSKDATIQVGSTEAEVQRLHGAGDLFFLTILLAGAQTTGQKAATTVICPVDAKLRSVSGFLNTPNAGSTFIIDTEINGTDSGPLLTIADGATAVTTARATSDIAVTAGSRIRAEIDQIGSGTAGSDLALCWGLERV